MMGGYGDELRDAAFFFGGGVVGALAGGIATTAIFNPWIGIAGAVGGFVVGVFVIGAPGAAIHEWLEDRAYQREVYDNE